MGFQCLFLLPTLTQTDLFNYSDAPLDTWLKRERGSARGSPIPVKVSWHYAHSKINLFK